MLITGVPNQKPLSHFITSCIECFFLMFSKYLENFQAAQIHVHVHVQCMFYTQTVRYVNLTDCLWEVFNWPSLFCSFWIKLLLCSYHLGHVKDWLRRYLRRHLKVLRVTASPSLMLRKHLLWVCVYSTVSQNHHVTSSHMKLIKSCVYLAHVGVMKTLVCILLHVGPPHWILPFME